MNKEELKVGMYIRTQYGYIARIKKINDTSIICDSQIFKATSYNSEHTKILKEEKFNQIVKASYNFIDMLEEGDVVKVDGGYYVGISIKFKDLKFFSHDGDEYLYNEIKGIITKEQLLSMCYNITGDK